MFGITFLTATKYARSPPEAVTHSIARVNGLSLIGNADQMRKSLFTKPDLAGCSNHLYLK